MNFYITVNNREIEAVKGETVLQTLRRAGISIPTLCNMEGFTPTGACRMCIVEISGKPDLIPACSCPVEEWMDVQTHSTRVIKARRMIVELLLSGHPDDCLYCERNCHCELQNLAFELNIRERKNSGKKINRARDLSNPAIIRDPAKCILCGRCVRVCDEIMSASVFEFSNRGDQSGITTLGNKSMNNSSCIACGQCVLVCPTGALYEKKMLSELQLALDNKSLHPIAVVDPVVYITLAEKYGNRNLRQAARQLNGVLKRCGFKEVYDYASLQDLYIIRAAREVLDMDDKTVISSICPAWVKFAEQFMPEQLTSISALKSPSQMAGSIIKAKWPGISVNITGDVRPLVVSITPCTARKTEAKRREFCSMQHPDVDLVITTRALEQFITLNGLDPNQAETEEYSKPFNTSSLHGELVSVSGGAMEAVAETVHSLLNNGQDLNDPKVKKSRIAKGVREIEFIHKKRKYRFAAVSGMAEARRFLQEAWKTPGKYCYIEVMACPAGCINGGGQPTDPDPNRYRSRQKQLIELAEKNSLTSSLRNRTINELTDDLLKGDDSLTDILTTQ